MEIVIQRLELDIWIRRWLNEHKSDYYIDDFD